MHVIFDIGNKYLINRVKIKKIIGFQAKGQTFKR